MQQFANDNVTSKNINLIDTWSQIIQIWLIIISLAWIANSIYSYTILDATGNLNAGLISGALHAMSGPDHLAAIMPSIICQKWWIALLYGLIWGAGHALSSSSMGIIGFTLKDSFTQSLIRAHYDHLFFDDFMICADIAVGPTLVLIGAMGLMELRTEAEDLLTIDKHVDQLILNVKQRNDDDEAGPISVSTSTTQSNTLIISNISGFRKHCSMSSLVFINGLFLGFSWDGLPSLGPTLTITSWDQIAKFLISYSIGTMLAMGIIASIVGLCTQWLRNTSTSTKGLPRRLAYISSIIAVVIGVTWFLQCLIRHVQINTAETNNDGLHSLSISENSSMPSRICSFIAVVVIFLNILDEFGFPFCSFSFLASPMRFKPSPLTV